MSKTRKGDPFNQTFKLACVYTGGEGHKTRPTCSFPVNVFVISYALHKVYLPSLLCWLQFIIVPWFVT